MRRATFCVLVVDGRVYLIVRMIAQVRSPERLFTSAVPQFVETRVTRTSYWIFPNAGAVFHLKPTRRVWRAELVIANTSLTTVAAALLIVRPIALGPPGIEGRATQVPAPAGDIS